MKQLNKARKFIFITRHGQRIDHSNERAHQKLHHNDPELTKEGREHPKRIGALMKQYMKKNFDFVFTPTNSKIISSPFSRTIQTSLNLSSVLLDDKNFDRKYISLDNRICEIIMEGEFIDKPKNLISHYQKSSKIEGYSKFEEYEGERFDNKQVLSTSGLPDHFEGERDAQSRFYKSLKEHRDNLWSRSDDR